MNNWVSCAQTVLVQTRASSFIIRHVNHCMTNNPYRNLVMVQKIPECLTMHWIKYLLEINTGYKQLLLQLTLVLHQYGECLSVYQAWTLTAQISDTSAHVTGNLYQHQMGEHLAWYAEQCHPVVVAAVLTKLFPFPNRNANPHFQAEGMVPECHTAVKTACNPRIVASPPALSSFALMLQTPAASSTFATASLTSSRGYSLVMGGSTSTICLRLSAWRVDCEQLLIVLSPWSYLPIGVWHDAAICCLDSIHPRCRLGVK